jgi:CBS domain-containing protein
MSSITVKDMMIPLEDYATVSQHATLYEAVQALEAAQKNFDQNRYQHRAVLVYDNNRQIVGKLSQLDVLQSLEPKYEGLAELKNLDVFGVDADYIQKMFQEHGLWKKPLDDICRKASSLKVKDIMYTPGQGEYVNESASINEALHQLVVRRHQSLLVTRGKEIVGILRLTDVFKRVCDSISACSV